MTAERSAPPGVPLPQGIGEDPFLHFTKVYLLFLQGLFQQFPSGCYRWDTNEVDSEIMITAQAPIPRDTIDQRPAIVVTRGPAQFANLSLDNVRSVNGSTGQREHTDLIPCTMTINCMAREGLEAQKVAWIVMRHIRTFKRLLQRNRIHKIGDEISISSESPPGALVNPEADSELVNVVVASPFFFQWTERIVATNAPLVQGIEAHMSLEISAQEAHITSARVREVYSKIPTIRGVPIAGTSVPIDGTTPEPVGTIDITVKT